MKLLDPQHHSEIQLKLGKFQKISVTSSATASRDQEVPSADMFQGRLCLISITRRDGTPMDPTSISEEDIVEICMKKDHTHPLGVLHYSAMESIILFSTMEDLNWLSRGLVDMTGLQNDAIMVATLAPTEAHIASFTTVWHLKPLLGDGELHTPPQQTPPSGGTPHHLQVELGDLNDHELQQLVQDLTQEIAQCELTAPPSNPLQMNGYAHWAVESQRRMTRRSPFQEGEGGVHQGNPPQFQSNHLGEGFP